MITEPLLAQWRDLVGQASPGSEAVPSGILCWFGAADFPSGAPGGPALGQVAFTSVLARLHAGDGGSTVPDPIAFGQRFQSWSLRAPVPIAVVDLDYDVPAADVLRAFTEAAQAGADHADLPGSLTDAVEHRHVFVASAIQPNQWLRPDPVHRGLTVTYALDLANYVGNPGATPPATVTVDLGDGHGPRDLPWSTRVTTTYDGPGPVTLTVCAGAGDQRREARCSVEVSTDPAPPDPTWIVELSPPQGLDPAWDSDPLTGWMGIYPGQADDGRPKGAIDDPVLLAEGFPGGATPAFLYEQMSGEAGLLDRLRAAGKDVVIVGFHQGAAPMAGNAPLVIDAVTKVNATLRAQTMRPNPLTVGGYSMGGLVTRLALCIMETAGLPHNTRTYVSVDTPHGRGSYTAPAAQWLVQHFGDLDPRLAVFTALLDSPANQEFAMLWYDRKAGKAVESPQRRTFLGLLEKFGGYPRIPRKLAASCGRGDGQRAYPPGQLCLRWRAEPLACADLVTLSDDGAPTTVATGSCAAGRDPFPAPLQLQAPFDWDAAPGGQDDYYALEAGVLGSTGAGTVEDPVQVECSVPVVSSLDLGPDIGPFDPVPADPKAAGSPFDAYTWSTKNNRHLQLEAGVVDWLFEQLTGEGGAG